METQEEWQSGKTFPESNIFMFENEIATDVIFTFPGSQEKIKAHKFILMSRSHVFFVMLSSDLHEPTKDIKIQEIEPAVFREFLRFLYCGELMITANNALHLLYTTQKYETLVLKDMCLKFLWKNITRTTVALILDQTVFYNEVELIDRCLKFLSRDSILQGLTHHHVSKETMEKIVESKELSARPSELFKACTMWAEIECKDKGMEVNVDNKRKMLGSVLMKIPLSNMTAEQIASEVSPSRLLTDEDELALFRSAGLSKVSSFKPSKINQAPLVTGSYFGANTHLPHQRGNRW